MSNETVISMRELEAESAELLPSRETLCGGPPPCHPACWCPPPPCLTLHIDICASLTL